MRVPAHLWAIVVSLWLGGCITEEPVHCDVDQQCLAYGAFCDQQTMTCRVPLDASVDNLDMAAEAGAPDAAVDGASDGAAVDMTEPPDLTTLCVSSQNCSDPKPVCDPGTKLCRACGVTGDGGLSSECPQDEPHCAGNGACVECLTKDDCVIVGKTCVAMDCVACSNNEDCTSGLCESGTCTDPSTI